MRRDVLLSRPSAAQAALGSGRRNLARGRIAPAAARARAAACGEA
jgi:hypothetical protein